MCFLLEYDAYGKFRAFKGVINGILGTVSQDNLGHGVAYTDTGVQVGQGSLVYYADGSIVSKTLLKKETGNITLFAFAQGQGLSEHTAPFDAVVYILDGEAVITIGGQPQTVAAGEMVIMPANVSHALQAKAKFKMLLVMIRGE